MICHMICQESNDRNLGLIVACHLYTIHVVCIVSVFVTKPKQIVHTLQTVSFQFETLVI